MPRLSKIQASGRSLAQGAFVPFGPNDVFRRDATTMARQSSNALAMKLANQINYGNEKWDYTGGGAGPRFYGYSGIGYSGSSGAPSTHPKAHIQTTTFVPTLFIVDDTCPTQKVTLLEEGTGEPRAPGVANNLQAYWENVPIPEVSKIAGGRLTVKTGSDHHLCIINKSTGELWEFWRFEGEPGKYTAYYGGYVANIKQWNGVFANGWGARATGFALIGGLLTMQDMVEALRGKPIGHALGLEIPSTGPGWVSPAVRSDKGAGQYDSTIPELHEGAANPAYPHTDAVPEGSWFAFPAGSHPSEHGINPAEQPIAAAIYEAIRDHGLTPIDTTSGNVDMPMEGPLGNNSSYAFNRVNPIYAAPIEWRGEAGWYTSAWRDSTLQVIKEEPAGEGAVLNVQPWNLLEALEPFS